MSEREVGIATFNSETEALMVADILKNEGILSVLVPLGAGAGGLGQSVWRPFQLRVRQSDAERARAILASFETMPFNGGEEDGHL